MSGAARTGIANAGMNGSFVATAATGVDSRVRQLSACSGLPASVLSSGRIAVKVINHYGDEVLKVHAV